MPGFLLLLLLLRPPPHRPGRSHESGPADSEEKEARRGRGRIQSDRHNSPPFYPHNNPVRHLWGWLNAVFNKVDHERIQAVGPDRAASEWLLRCGAHVRYQGLEKWQQDYNALPTGPLGRYKIQAIDATDSCIMYRGFDHLDGLEHVEEIKLCKCMYLQDECLQRLSGIPNLQRSLLRLWVISCGNVTDKGIIALHKLNNLQYLHLSDLPGIKQKEATAEALRKALPSLELELNLE